jgi:hypothetical protein
LSAERPLASPLTIIDDAERADEVLLLTYSCNLAFWERFAVNRARALGALVSIVADPTVVDADPAAIRHSGVAYLDGRAICPSGGAFHPKLAVVCSDEHAVVAIGSGNVSVGGWHANAELWTVLRAGVDGAPSTMHDVADWLAALPKHLTLSPHVPDALQRVAGRLRSFETVGPGPALFHNLDQRILEALPTGPVDELVIYGPFYDRAAQAVDALAGWMQPDRLRVLLQPDHAVVDGSHLAKVVARHGGRVEPLADDRRYHHGKLIQWRHDGQWYALTGSPNPSRSALLQTIADGGNCELAVLAPVPESLAPRTSPAMTPAQVGALAWRPREEPPPSLLLLAARLDTDGLHLTLGRPLQTVATVQVADRDVWSDLTAVPAGETVDLSLPGEIAPAPGAALRLCDEQGRQSNIVFLLGWRALRPQRRHEGRVLVDEETIFDNLAIAEAFAEDLAALRQYLPEGSRRPPPPPGAGPTGGHDGNREHETWEHYLERCAAAIGERMLHFALPLPDLGLGNSPAAQPFDETHQPDGDPEAGEAGEEGTDTRAGSPPDLSALSARQRRRWQRWCEQLAAISHQLVPVGRLTAARLIVRRVGAGLWEGPEEWVPLVAKATAALGADPKPTGPERGALAAMAAVGLAMVRNQIHRFGGYDPLRAHYDHALAAVRGLLDQIDLRLLDVYVADLDVNAALAMPAAEVLDLATDAFLADPLDSAIEILADEFDITVHRSGQVLTVLGDVPDEAQQHTALRVVGLAQDGAPVAAVVGDDDRHVLCVWSPPQVVLVIRNPHLTRGIVHTLAANVGPRYYAEHGDERLPNPEHWTGFAVPVAAARALQQVGRDPAAPFAVRIAATGS